MVKILEERAAMASVLGALLVLGCGSDAGPLADSTVVDSDGASASVETEGGEAEVEIPAGAVSEEITITVQPTEADAIAALPGAATMPVDPVVFTPHGTLFAEPVTIRFTVDGGVPSGAVIARLADEEDDTWEILDATIDGNTISTQVTSFSVYAVVEGLGDDEPCSDIDDDGICDVDDACPHSATGDSDADGVCDDVDICPADATNDSDGDGVCDSEDPCPADAPDDSDGDGICDSNDPCHAPSDDADDNGVCDDMEVRFEGAVLVDGVASAGVVVDFQDSSEQLLGKEESDASGAFTFHAMAAGTYLFVAYTNDQCVFGYQEVTVALGDVTDVVFDLTNGCSL